MNKKEQLFDVLTSLGYKPHEDADGDLVFRYQMKFFCALTGGEDGYVTIMLPQFSDVEEGEEHIALAVLAQSGDLLLARRIWEDGEQNMSSLQNQMMCCLLMDLRSYSKAIHLASSLYASYGSEFIVTVCNGFEVITADRLMPTFLGEIVNASDGIWWWDKAVKRQGDMAIGYLWSETKAAYHIGKL